MSDAEAVAAAELDALVLELRSAGRSFPSIARTLGLRGADEANEAFVRALHRRSPRERERLRNDELERLDLLEAQVRGDADMAPFDRDVRLARVAKLRAPLQERTFTG